MKVGVVGTGLVGAAAAFALVLRGSCSELVLVDQDEARAWAEAADIGHAVPVSHPVRVSSGDYPALAGARVVVVAAGVNQAPGQSRLELLEQNADIFREVIPRILRAAPDAVLIIATNPVDVLTGLSARLAPRQAVFGSGTVLDSARFQSALAERAGVDPQHVHAYVLGEHGDSEVLAWSGAAVAGQPLADFLEARGTEVNAAFRAQIDTEVRGAAAQIIAGKRATQYGVGAALARMVEAVVQDRRSVLTVSAPDESGVAYSLPRVVGGAGVLHTAQPRLNAEEQAALSRSVQIIREALASC